MCIQMLDIKIFFWTPSIYTLILSGSLKLFWILRKVPINMISFTYLTYKLYIISSPCSMHRKNHTSIYLDSKVHEANMGPTWVLLAPEGPHVGPMNLASRVCNDLFHYTQLATSLQTPHSMWNDRMYIQQGKYISISLISMIIDMTTCDMLVLLDQLIVIDNTSHKASWSFQQFSIKTKSRWRTENSIMFKFPLSTTVLTYHIKNQSTIVPLYSGKE